MLANRFLRKHAPRGKRRCKRREKSTGSRKSSSDLRIIICIVLTGRMLLANAKSYFFRIVGKRDFEVILPCCSPFNTLLGYRNGYTVSIP